MGVLPSNPKRPVAPSNKSATCRQVTGLLRVKTVWRWAPATREVKPYTCFRQLTGGNSLCRGSRRLGWQRRKVRAEARSQLPHAFFCRPSGSTAPRHSPPSTTGLNLPPASASCYYWAMPRLGAQNGLCCSHSATSCGSLGLRVAMATRVQTTQSVTAACPSAASCRLYLPICRLYLPICRLYLPICGAHGQ